MSNTEKPPRTRSTGPPILLLARLWPLWLLSVSVVIGLRYDWKLAAGCVWFGLSLAAMIWALRSFRTDPGAGSSESG